MPDLALREMVLEDLPVVMAIERQSFNTPWSERSLRFELVENPSARLLVAETSGSKKEVIGYIGFWMLRDTAHINTLAVAPHHRRKGIAQMLIRSAMRRAFQGGATRMSLEVRGTNTHAIRLYRKMGFEISGLRPGYYKDTGEEAMVMTMENIQSFLAAVEGGEQWVRSKS